MLALMALNRKKSGVNCVEQEEERRYMRWSWKIEALKVFNRKSSGIKGVELEK